MIAEYVELLTHGKQNLLTMRAISEKEAGYKDPKAMAKKYAGEIVSHEAELTKFRINVKACKSMLHVYLQVDATSVDDPPKGLH